MDEEKRKKIRKRVLEFLKRSDDHFRESKYDHGTLKLDEAANLDLIEESRDLLGELEELHRSEEPSSGVENG